MINRENPRVADRHLHAIQVWLCEAAARLAVALRLARSSRTRRYQDAGAHEKQDRGALKVRVARACDEEDFRDRVTGEDGACGRETNLLPGSPGRGRS